ncbi:hypothetical protein [Treponema sp. R80B11-R83G3]
MKDNPNLKILIIVIISIAAIVITTIFMIAHFVACELCKNSITNLSLWEVCKIDKDSTKTMVPIINTSNNETADDIRALTVTNVIQRVLDNTVMTNNDIALMAVYSEDGTILADLKPDRIGKNMLDVDEELSYFMKDMLKAMKNRRIYSGSKYDPSLNEYIRFIVKPLQIGMFDQKLSLLIGIYGSK